MKHSTLLNTIAAASLALAAGMTNAQSVLEATQAAKNNDASYTSAKALLQASLARASQYKGALAPDIGIQGSVTQTDMLHQPLIDGVAQRKTRQQRVYDAYTGALTLKQPLYDSAAWAQYKQADPLIAKAQAQLHNATQELTLKVAQAYFDVLTAQDTLAFLEAQKATLAEQLANAKRSWDLGTTTITAVRDAQAKFDMTVAQVLSTQSEIQVKQLALENLTGNPSLKPQKLSAKQSAAAKATQDLDYWLGKAMENNPLLMQAKYSLELATLDVDKASAGHKPTINAQLSYASTRNVGGSAISENSSYTLNPSASVVLTLPLFDGMVTSNRVKEAVFMQEKARADLESTQKSVTQSVKSAFLAVSSGIEQVKAYEAALESSQTALQANKRGYSVGLNVTADVLNAQTQLLQASRDLSKAKHELWMSYLKLGAAAGELSDEFLAPLSSE